MSVPPTILVVIHDATVGRTIQASLERIGFKGVFANTCEQALAWLDQQGPDSSVVALVALALPGSLGGRALGYRLNTIYEVPFLYLAQAASELQDRRVIETQPHGYILPNTSDEELRATLTLAGEWLKECQDARPARVSLVTPSTQSEATIVTDLSGRITYLNTLAEDLTGWSLAEAMRQPYQSVFQLVDERECRVVHEPLASGRNRGALVDAKLRRRQGGILRIRERTSSLTHGDGSLAGLFIAFFPEPQSEGPPAVPASVGLVNGGAAPLAGAKPSAAPLANMLDAVPDPLFTLDAHWRFTYANRAAIDLFGRGLDSLLGKDFREEFQGSELQQACDALAQGEGTQQTHEFEFHLEERDQWLELHAYPFPDGVLVFLTNITQRRKEQERASKLEKLENLGLLARGFAHDFNNLLTVLIGNLSIARTAEPGQSDYHDSLNAAKHATEQARNLVQQLLTFAKGGVPIAERIDLNRSVVREVFTQHRKSSHVDYDLSLADEAIMVEADPGQLRRLLQNLIRNAEEAMLSGGELRISSKILSRDDPICLHQPVSLDRKTDYAVLEIHDTGMGIPDVHLDKVFEPYFSTRTDANATGLGLTVCESIARSHNGFLSIDSRYGSHTTARLFIPTLRQTWDTERTRTGEARRPSASTDEDNDGHRRILILEDERPIRILMGLSLKKDGYKVVETAEGSETVSAYSKALEEGRRFDLVIMDLSIPNGMGGAEAIQQIRHTDPEVLAVVSSGYSDDPVMSNYEHYGFSAVLPKPYEPSSLRQLAHRLITGEELPLEA